MNFQQRSKPIATAWAVLTIAVGVAVLVSACASGRKILSPPPPQTQAAAPDSPTPTATGDVPYAYYYDVEVYYQPVIKIYWWYNGTDWISGPRLPVDLVLHEDARVMVNLNATEPWNRHEYVRQQHPRKTDH